MTARKGSLFLSIWNKVPILFGSIVPTPVHCYKNLLWYFKKGTLFVNSIWKANWSISLFKLSVWCSKNKVFKFSFYFIHFWKILFKSMHFVTNLKLIHSSLSTEIEIWRVKRVNGVSAMLFSREIPHLPLLTLRIFSYWSINPTNL